MYCGRGERNARIELEMCMNFAQLYLRGGLSKINEQNASIATGSLYLYTEFDAI